MNSMSQSYLHIELSSRNIIAYSQTLVKIYSYFRLCFLHFKILWYRCSRLDLRNRNAKSQQQNSFAAFRKHACQCLKVNIRFFIDITNFKRPINSTEKERLLPKEKTCEEKKVQIGSKPFPKGDQGRKTFVGCHVGIRQSKKT